MRLVVSTFVTIDGVVQAPGMPDEDPSGGFEHGGWQAPLADQQLGDWLAEGFERIDGLLFGRTTYEILGAHWPHMEDGADGPASALNAAPKHVVSTTLETADWKPATIYRDVAEVATLKEQPGRDLQVIGSAQLVRSLAELDLVDAYHLWIYPLVLGDGKRLFGPHAAPRAFHLDRARTTDNGAIFAEYVRAGEVQTGAFPRPGE
jgi:dihydrofolate reductase